MQLWSKTKHGSSLRALIALSTLFALLFGDIETVLAQTSLFDKQVNYQAKLMTPAGIAVPDGAYNLWFRLYLTPSSATTSNIWEEQYVAGSKVQVQNGLLSVMLGSVNSLAGVNWNQPLYLGVEVGGSTTPQWDGEMSPRKILGAVPAAFTAETLAGLTANQFVRSDATSTIATSSAQTLLTINQLGSGNILDLKASGVTLASFLANGNVGIGTSSPYAKLSVAGAVVAAYFTATSTATSSFGGGLNITGGCYAMSGTCLATSSGITSLNGLSTLAQTFATGTDANIALTIVSAGSTHTFTPAWVGTLAVARGGTGTSTAPTFGQLLIGSGSGYDLRATSSLAIALTDTTGILAANRGGTGLSAITQNQLLIGGAGNTVLQVATSSLGLPQFTDLNSYFSLAAWFATTTTALQEGTNLYFTNTRADARINATNTLGTLFFLPNLQRSTTTFATTTYLAVTGSGTSSFANGLNLTSGCYAVSGVCLTQNSSASSTLLVDNNTFAGTNQFNKLTVTNSTSTNATSTSFFASVLNVTTGTLTNLFGTLATITGITSTNSTSTNATSTNLSATNLVATNLVTGGATTSQATSTNLFTALFSATFSTIGNLLVTSSTTLQNATLLNSTSSQATSTNLFANVLSALGGTIGTLANTNLTGSTATFNFATTTNLFAQNASTTNATSSYGFFSNQLTAVNGKFTGAIVIPVTSCAGGQALNTDSSGNVVCGTVTTGGSSVGGGWTTNNVGAVTLATTSDRVGIGATTTSYAKLSVISGSTATTTFALLPASGQTANIIDIYNTSGVLSSVLTAGGSLGIATTSPSATLEVGGTGFFSGLATLFGGLFAPNATITNSTSTNVYSTNLFAQNATFTGATTTALNVSGNSTTSFGGGVSTPLLAVTGVSTSTFNNGINLVNGCLSYNGSSCLTQGLTSAITSIGPVGALQTGPAITFATSSTAYQGLTASTTITASGQSITFANTMAGVLTAGGGGTGISNPSVAGILLGSYGGGAYQQLATSSLGLLTNNVAEGSNLYFTAARADARVNATDTLGTLLYLPNLQRSTTTLATTTALFSTTASSTNLYTTNFFGAGLSTCATALTYNSGAFGCNAAITGASSTLLTDNNTFSGTNQFNKLTFTNATGTNATTTNLFANTLFATNGTFNQITATSTTATSSFAAAITVGAGQGTSTFAGGLSATQLSLTGAATNTAANGFNLTNGCFSIAGTCLSSTAAAAIGGTGAIQFANGSAFAGDNTQFFFDNTNKALTLGTSTAYAKLSIQGAFGSQQKLFDIASSTNANGSATTSILTVLANGNVGIGTGAPQASLDVFGISRASGGNGNEALNVWNTSNGSSAFVANTAGDVNITGQGGYGAGTGLQIQMGNATNWTPFMISLVNPGDGMILDNTGNVSIGTTTTYAKLSLMGLYGSQLPLLDVASSTNANSSATSSFFRISANGNVGIGTSTPYAKLSIVGQVVAAFFTATTTATSSFGGNLAINGTGTSTSAGGFNLTAGCFSISGACLTPGSSASSTLFADTNTFSGQNIFSNILRSTTTQATSTNFFSNALFGVLGTFGNIISTSSATSTFAAAITVGAGQGTSTFAAGLSANVLNILSTTATSTFGNGLSLSSGCFSIAGNCLSAGSTASTTLLADSNTFSGKNAFTGATTTFSNAITVGAGQGTSTFAAGLSATALNVTSTTATSTFANGIVLSGGCFRDTNATSTCIGRGQSATYVVAASNSIGKAYADFVGSGTGDQAAINAAIQAAYSASRGMGGKVYLLEGDYSVNGTTTMATGTMLIGSGNGTIIKLANSVNSNVNIIDATNVSYVTIADLLVDGNRVNNSGIQYGVSFTSVGTSSIRGITASGTSYYGIYVTTSNNIIIQGNTANGSGQTGIGIASSNNIITGNIVNGNGLYGILLFNNSNYNLVSNNIVRANSNNGIFLNASSYALVSGNTIIGNSTGINTGGGSANITITGNTVSSNSSVGISLASNSTIANNVINKNSLQGIAGSAVSNSSITGNTLYDNGGSGANDSISLTNSSNVIISSNQIQDTAGTGFAINITGSSIGNVLTGNYYSGVGATNIQDLGTNTKYTEWDRLTLDTLTLGSVAYSPIYVFASSSASSTMEVSQRGSGKLASFYTATSGEVFTIANSGAVGIGSSSPWAKLSVALDTTNPAFVVANNGSSSPTLFVGGVNQNGFIGLGTTTNSSLARMTVDNSVNQSGSTYAIGGLNEMYTFNPSVANTLQVGDRFVGINAPTSATNTAIGKIVRMIDNSSLSNLVRGIEVSAAAGNNTWGVNTGLRATGHTYGVQALTTGLAGGSSTPAALYGENTGTTQGDILRLYTSTMTTATSVAQFYQEISAYSGAGLYMDFGNGGGTFTGNFLDLRVNGNQRFVVSAAGTTTIGQPNQTTNQAGLQIGYGGLCVDNDGLCNASTTGRVSAVSYTTGSTDLAENYYATETLEAGDIVTTRGKYLIGRAASSTHAVLGIISTKPGVILGEGEKSLEDLPAYPVALSGRVPVKVSDESGIIHVGDHVVLSSLDGIGMAEGSSTPFGHPTVGIALEEFDGTHYLSEATIDTETTRVPTGTPLCTTKTSVSVEKNAGGKDVEGGIGTAYGASATVTNTDCKQEMVDVVPNSGSALSSSTATREVKIGKIVVFVEHGASTQNYATPGLSWEEGADGAVAMKFWESLDMNGNKIFNLGRIEGVNGNWWIDENGEMHAQRIIARDIEATEKLNVGSAAHPSGITIFDKDTGLPYCLVMASGALVSNSGSCDNISGTSNTTSSVPAPPPDTSSTTPTPPTTTDTGTASSTPPAPLPIGSATVGDPGSSTPSIL